jgi:hypothetical protein
MKEARWISKEEKDAKDIDSIIQKIKQPVIFLLGAGASAAAGLPTMGSFLEDVYGENFIDSLEKRTGYRLNTSNVEEASTNPTELTKMLFHLASLNRKSVCYDLEVVFELIHQIQGLLSGQAEASKKLIGLFQMCAVSPGIDFSHFKAKYNNEKKRLNKWFQDMSQVITTLREKMYDRYLVEEPSDQIINLWMIYKNLFSKCKVDKPVVFTTNYDTLFEALHDHGQMDFDLINGVQPKRQRRVFELGNYLKEDSEKSLYLFKMHGSVTWERKNGVVSDHFPARKPVSGTPSLKKPLGIVEPVLSKSEFVPPFSYMYTIFDKMVHKPITCVCIGFSFRDENLFGLVSRFLKEQKEFRLVCVSPEEKEADETIAFDVNENIRKLEGEYDNAIWIKEYFKKGRVIDQIAKQVILHSSAR